VFRIDSAYHSAAVLGAIRRAGAYFPVTVPQRRDVRAAIAAIPEDAWIPVTHPRAIWDEAQKRLISDAEIAEVPYTAFALKKKGQAITARLIVRGLAHWLYLEVRSEPEIAAAHQHWREAAPACSARTRIARGIEHGRP
jgi:hypothetical protein